MGYESDQADVIVAATRGYAALAAVLEGSVSQRLLHLAHCPVLVIPPSAETEATANAEVA